MVTKKNGGRATAGSEPEGGRRGASGAGPAAEPAGGDVRTSSARRNCGAVERGFAAIVAAVLAFALGPVASAQAGTAFGKVTGSVRRPDPAKRPETPVRNRGFVQRIRNQMIPPRPYDPLPYVVVVLEPQNALDAEDEAPPKTAARYELIGESFRTPLFPVVVKATLEIRNLGTEPHRLTAPSLPDFLPPDPINPKGVRSATLVRPYRPVEIRDPDSPHLKGTLVAFPLRYIAQVEPDGDFVIEDVPAGRWKVRLWYRNGWLKVPPVTIDVSNRRTTSVKAINFPANPQVDVPASGKGEE